MIAVLPYVTHPKTAVLGRAGGASLESSDGQDAEPADNKENLQSISLERQAAIKEKLDKWCEEKTPQ